MSSNPNGGPDHVDENGNVINPADVEGDGFAVDHYDDEERARHDIPEPIGPWVQSTQPTARSGASLPRGQEVDAENCPVNQDTDYINTGEIYLRMLAEERAARENGTGRDGPG